MFHSEDSLLEFQGCIGCFVAWTIQSLLSDGKYIWCKSKKTEKREQAGRNYAVTSYNQSINP